MYSESEQKRKGRQRGQDICKGPEAEGERLEDAECSTTSLRGEHLCRRLERKQKVPQRLITWHMPGSVLVTGEATVNTTKIPHHVC